MAYSNRFGLISCSSVQRGRELLEQGIPELAAQVRSYAERSQPGSVARCSAACERTAASMDRTKPTRV